MQLAGMKIATQLLRSLQIAHDLFKKDFYSISLSIIFLVSSSLTRFPSDYFLKFNEFCVEDFRHFFIDVHLKCKQQTEDLN